jgi:ribosomal-protein-alanine N-acetyltransferase
LKGVIGERLIGIVVGDRRRRHSVGWIATLGVHPDFRRRGYARELLRTCEQELDMRHVRLTLRRSNHAAKNLYLAVGYTEVDVWPKYYSNGEDGIVMEKRL